VSYCFWVALAILKSVAAGKLHPTFRSTPISFWLPWAYKVDPAHICRGVWPGFAFPLRKCIIALWFSCLGLYSCLWCCQHELDLANRWGCGNWCWWKSFCPWKTLWCFIPGSLGPKNHVFSKTGRAYFWKSFVVDRSFLASVRPQLSIVSCWSASRSRLTTGAPFSS
jgi:hypothetical protein